MPNEELSYVIVTLYSMRKSRTGGIIARLISRTGLDLVTARMFAPSEELVKKYADATISANDPQDRRIQELIYKYIQHNLAPDPKTGRRRRVMVVALEPEPPTPASAEAAASRRLYSSTAGLSSLSRLVISWRFSGTSVT